MKRAYVFLASVLCAAVAVAALGGADGASAAEGRLAKGCGGGQVSLGAAEKQTLVLHNRIRRDRGLPRFCVDRALTEAAEFHSEEMISGDGACDYFHHDSWDCATGRYYEDFAARIGRFGYDYRVAGENIAWGSGPYAEPASRMDAWMKSPGHRRNILDEDFREVGIGVVEGTYRGSGGAAMFTVDFGTKP